MTAIWIAYCINANVQGHSWCYAYYHQKWTRWSKFKSWMKLFAFCIALIRVIPLVLYKYADNEALQANNKDGHQLLFINKLTTLVEGDLKAPISTATTPRCRGGLYSIPWIAPLYSWFSPYNAASSTIFWIFGMTQPGIEPWSPRPLANTLLIRPMARLLITKVILILVSTLSCLSFYKALQTESSPVPVPCVNPQAPPIMFHSHIPILQSLPVMMLRQKLGVL